MNRLLGLGFKDRQLERRFQSEWAHSRLSTELKWNGAVAILAAASTARSTQRGGDVVFMVVPLLRLLLAYFACRCQVPRWSYTLLRKCTVYADLVLRGLLWLALMRSAASQYGGASPPGGGQCAAAPGNSAGAPDNEQCVAPGVATSTTAEVISTAAAAARGGSVGSDDGCLCMVLEHAFLDVVLVPLVQVLILPLPLSDEAPLLLLASGGLMGAALLYGGAGCYCALLQAMCTPPAGAVMVLLRGLTTCMSIASLLLWPAAASAAATSGSSCYPPLCAAAGGSPAAAAVKQCRTALAALLTGMGIVLPLAVCHVWEQTARRCFLERHALLPPLADVPHAEAPAAPAAAAAGSSNSAAGQAASTADDTRSGGLPAAAPPSLPGDVAEAVAPFPSFPTWWVEPFSSSSSSSSPSFWDLLALGLVLPAGVWQLVSMLS